MTLAENRHCRAEPTSPDAAARAGARANLCLGHRPDQRHRTHAGTRRRLVCRLRYFLLLLMAFLYATAYLFAKGIGIWGTTIPVGWAFPIVNFVWWVGIGHAGTLISAILLLLRQDWRTSINRFAEAMTLFAVSCAGLFPLLHLGRPWVFHWLLPYPNTMDLWPQFPQPAGVGRVRRAHLLHGFAVVLVRRA